MDELKGAKVHVRVNKPDFVMIPDGELLTKMAAHYGIKKLEQQNKGTEEVAVKYQVLSKHTAFIGVVKQVDKVISSEELKQVTITEASLLSKSINSPSFMQASYGHRLKQIPIIPENYKVGKTCEMKKRALFIPDVPEYCCYAESSGEDFGIEPP